MCDAYSYSRTLRSANEGSEDATGTLMKESYMDALEQRIFKDAKLGAQAMENWLQQKH